MSIDLLERPAVKPHIRIYADDELQQGSEAWLQARCGLLTASTMGRIITPSLKIAANDKERAHLYELVAQRITNHVEPQYINDDMLRGHEDEIDARALYSKKYAPAREVGFITNSKWGFTIGYSPDGLVGDDGLIECKSRRQKFQVQTILEGGVPAEYLMQCQTGLLVAEREWIDFISYSGGLPMFVTRVHPDAAIQNAIVEAAGAFEARMTAQIERYGDLIADLIPTERKIEVEMF
jgi:hypothetical protein